MEELLAFNMEFDGTDELDFAVAAKEAIKVIQHHLMAITNEQQVLLFAVE